MQWGLEILGPFSLASGKIKYLIVVVDYFTKWIEAKALSNITTMNVLKFFKTSILARFGIPHSILTDNGMQLIDKRLKSILEELRIKQHFASVEHLRQTPKLK